MPVPDLVTATVAPPVPLEIPPLTVFAAVFVPERFSVIVFVVVPPVMPPATTRLLSPVAPLVKV